MTKNRKFIFAALFGLMAAGVASADIDSIDYSITTTNTGVNTRSYVIRGQVQAVRVIVPSNATGDVAIASNGDTIFSKSAIAASASFTPRVGVHSTAGVANTNLFDKYAAYGSVTSTVTGASTGTNTYTVRIIFNK